MVDHIVSVGDQRSSAELLEPAVVFVSRLVTLGFGEPPSHLGSSDFFRNNSSIKCGQGAVSGLEFLALSEAFLFQNGPNYSVSFAPLFLAFT